jgi:uncharacterized protein YqhQ
MKLMPNIWLDTLTTFNDSLEQIELCLHVLKENAKDADFLDSNVKTYYSSDIIYMKQLFEKAESLSRSK